MNLIDLLLILLVIGSLALGFFLGMIRLGVMLLGFYLALVLSSLYFPSFGGFIHSNFGGTRFAADYIAFFLLLVVSFSLLAWAGIYTFRYAQMPGRLKMVDHFVGVFLGILLGAFVVGVLSALLWNLMVVRGGRSIESPLFGIIGNGVYNSFLLNYFASYILPQTYDILEPILPDGARLIFEVSEA